MSNRGLPLIAALVVLLLSGLVHGIWTQRWQTSQVLEEACARVAEVPTTAGSWTAVNVETDAEPFQQARAAAWWMRRYSSGTATGPITVILMCGRPNHMSVHTPDICYSGAGFEMVGEQARKSIFFAKGSRTAEFWTASFRQPAKAAGNALFIWWTWGDQGGWRAPTSPRWSFGAEPFLYKLYIAHENANDNATADFLRQLLPVLEQALFTDIQGTRRQ